MILLLNGTITQFIDERKRKEKTLTSICCLSARQYFQVFKVWYLSQYTKILKIFSHSNSLSLPPSLCECVCLCAHICVHACVCMYECVRDD